MGPLHRLRRSPSPFRGGILALAFLATPASAATIAITHGTLAIGDGSQPIPNGALILRDGRVVAAGANVAVPAGAQVIDATGKWVAAGIVAGLSDEGIVDVSGVDEVNDASARNSPFSAAIDVAPAVNPAGMTIAVDRAGGVTRAIVAPNAAKSIFAGQGAVIDLGADPDAITRARAFQYVELGEDGAKGAGGSRAAAHVLFRNALLEAQDYKRNPGGYGGRASDDIMHRLDAAALVPVIEGKVPLLIHVERASDILAVLAIKREFPALKIVITGASEGWLVAPQLAAAHVPVIAEAIEDLPAAFESLAATQSNVGRMTKAGVTVAISTIDEGGSPQQRNLRQSAGNLVALTKVPGATGLDWGAAFATITSKPADAIGMGDELGSLRPGRRADVVLWDGDPLELSSAPTAVFIDGVAEPLTNRQTRLLQRYLKPQEGALPKAYER